MLLSVLVIIVVINVDCRYYITYLSVVVVSAGDNCCC